MIDPEIRSWWPAIQSLELVEASMVRASSAVQAELQRFDQGAQIESQWLKVGSFSEAMRSVPFLTTMPTDVILLPTTSRWVVVWDNSFLCSGWDSLCHCLTKNHELTTVHWSAHDKWTTFQSGACFSFRRNNDGTLKERVVHVIQEDKRWTFFQRGDPIPEENIAAYGARRKRDRLNEASLMALLNRLDARPWSSDFYAFATAEINVLRRTSFPDVIRESRRTWDQVLMIKNDASL